MQHILAALRPRSLAAILSLLFVAWALGYALSEEPGVGRIRGRVIYADSKRPVPRIHVTLTPLHARGRPRRIRTGPDGTFFVRSLPAGSYDVSAATHAHLLTNTYVTVDEGGVTQLNLALTPSYPDLTLAQHPKVFGTAQEVQLRIRGYVDGSKPPGQDTVRLRLFRTRLSHLLPNEKMRDALDQIQYNDLPRLPDVLIKPPGSIPPPQIRLQRDFPLTEADREGYYNQRLNLGRMEPGVYLIDIAHAKATQCSWFLVSDTALIVKRAENRVTAYTVNMDTGDPLGGCVVRAYRNGSVLARATTDRRGLAQFEIPTARGSAQLMLVAEQGQDEAVVRDREYENESRGRFTVYAYTDRPIYRPGQRIYYKGILRRTLDPGIRYRVPFGESVTVEVRDPNGERLLREAHAVNAFGSFFGTVDLSPEAPTGRYTLITTVRGETHTDEIVVASYRKPEFSVRVTPGKEYYVRDEEIQAEVSAQYYFGAPMVGASVHYSVYLQPDWAAEYPDDYGYDEEEDEPDYRAYGDEAYGETVTEGDLRLDENGRAVIRFPAKASDSPEAAQAHTFDVYVTVTDESGRSESGSVGVPIKSGDFRLSVSPQGYVGEPGRPTGVVITAKGHDGKPKADLPFELEMLYQRWDSKTDKYVYRSAGIQRGVTGPDGRAIVQVVPPRAGDLRLNVRANDAAGRIIRARAYLWVADEEGGELETEYSDLSLLTDKRRYRPGDTARALINTQRVGQTALVTIEGTRVYKALLVPITKRSTILHVPILADYGPNVFLSACYVRDRKFARSETPLRVTVPEREIHVSITPDRPPNAPEREQAERSVLTPDALPRYAPRDRITYQIQTTDSKGRPAPCELSFGVVDESIYALRKDDPEALRDRFYPRRYNAVETSYSFAVEYLGDADKAEPKIEARRKFLDTAYWKPDLRTDAEGRATISFQLPDNLTTWRATACAQTTDTRLGYNTSKVIVTKEFFVRMETPRFLTQRDRSRILAIVHNETGAPQTALVRLRTTGLTMGGRDIQTLHIGAGQTGQAEWAVIAEGAERARITVTAWTPKVTGARQYTDGVQTSLPVRPYGRESIVSFAGELTAANPETETLRFDPLAIPQASQLTIRITPSITSALTGALDYLIGYPYGCTEQTMSRFLPDVLVHRVMQLRGSHFGLSRQQREELPAMVRDGLTRLYRYQHASGGWGWWEHDPDDPWMTAYVLYGLATAREAGYSVSRRALQRGREAAIKLLSNAKMVASRSFLLYALALAGDTKTARAEREKVRLDTLGAEEVAYLVLLDKLLGRSTREARAALDRLAVSQGDMLYWSAGRRAAPTGIEYRDWNSRMTTAVALRALVAVNPRDPRIGSALRWLMRKRTGEYWESTRDTSWALAALCDYLAARPDEATPTGEVRVRLNGRLIQTYTLTPDLAREAEIVLRVPASQLRPGKNDVMLERVGGTSRVFYSVHLRQTIAAESLEALSPAKITVHREYLRLVPRKAGGGEWSLQTEPTNNRLQQGDRIRVRLTIQVPEEMSYVLIEDPLPSGCEVTERGSAEETVEWGYWWSSVDVRDDRVAFFARTLLPGTQIIEYNLRAQTPGIYQALPALVQGMYATEKRAESAGATVEVR